MRLLEGMERHQIERPRSEDDTVWLLPCLVVHPQHRGQGISHALVDAALTTAQRYRAIAFEAWPSSLDSREADGFTGRQGLFEDLGFEVVAQPSPIRGIVRRQLID